MELETVKIVDGNKRGFKIINKRDFDPKKHELYKATKTRSKKAK